jgi:hypothetical protein
MGIRNPIGLLLPTALISLLGAGALMGLYPNETRNLIRSFTDACRTVVESIAYLP